MKKVQFVHAALAAAFVIACAPARAAAGAGPKARIFAQYDTNKNGVIDGDEVAAVRKAYAEDPKGQFARYDTNHDGKLSDEEIALIKPPGAKKDGARKKGGAKHDGAEKTDAPVTAPATKPAGS